MKYSEAKQGRTFVIRLEHGDIVHEKIENFAKEKNIVAASVTIVGGVDKGSTLVVGPEKGDSIPISPMTIKLDNVYEVTGTGTVFPDEEGKPMLHMHIACGREDKCFVGCIRKGVKTWNLLEVIILEIIDTKSYREFNKDFGFHLLQPKD